MMTRGRFARAALILIATVLAVSVASALIGVSAPSSETGRFILTNVRLPRIAVALCVGAILAGAGATFQNLLRNSLADPFILGVSGGAACAAAVVSALGLGGNVALVEASAFVGATIATGGVFLLARKHGSVDPTRLIIAGLVLNSLFSAVILIALSSTRGTDLSAALRWMMGSLSSVGWPDAIVLLAVTAIAAVALQFIAGDLRMFAFGEDDARSRGVPVDRLRVTGFLIASVATGAAVAVTGIIGFVGLLVPHWVRSVWHLDFRATLPLSMLGGAALMVAADTAARSIHPPAELPVGALLALIGVPFFIAILRGR